MKKVLFYLTIAVFLLIAFSFFPPGSCIKNSIILAFRDLPAGVDIELRALPEGVDICSVEILQTVTSNHYISLIKDNRHVWRTSLGYDSRMIKEADAKTFRFLGKDPAGGNYFVDKNHIYLEGFPLKDSDPTTFSFLNFKYSKDQQHVYYFGKLIPEADANTFSVIDEFFSKDKQHIYYCDKIIPEASPSAKLNLIKSSYYITDGQNFYYPGVRKIHEVDLGSFQALDLIYAKDKNYVYYKGNIIPLADPKTISTLDNGYSKDQHRVFYNDLLIENLKPTNFRFFRYLPKRGNDVVSNIDGTFLINYDDKTDTVQVTPYDEENSSR